MMNNLIYILLLLTACGTKKLEPQKVKSLDTALQSEPKISPMLVEVDQTRPKLENTFIDSSQFKIDNQSSFSLQNWHYGARREKLVIMTVDEIRRYFQDSKLKNNLENYYSNYYFFSIQKVSQGTVITLIEEYDTCCADLWLMSYDANSKLISKEKVAGTGGDGGWYYNEFGIFTSNSNYELTRIDRETLRDEQDTTEYRIDSVVTKFRVNKDLSFTKENEQAFQRSLLIAN